MVRAGGQAPGRCGVPPTETRFWACPGPFGAGACTADVRLLQRRRAPESKFLIFFFFNCFPTPAVRVVEMDLAVPRGHPVSPLSGGAGWISANQ